MSTLTIKSRITQSSRELAAQLIESGDVDSITEQLIERGIADGPPFIHVPTDYVAKDNQIFHRDQPWLTVHAMTDRDMTPEDQAVLLADALNNDDQEVVWPAPATGSEV